MSKKVFFPLANEISAEKNFVTSRFLTTTALIGVVCAPSSLKAAEEKVKQLPTVTVIDSRDKGYQAKESSNNKITGNLLDQPRTVTTVTRQLMDDQGITKVSDALRNVPGISLAAGEGGNQGDNITIRGFSARSDFFIDGMRDYGSYFRDAFNTDSIEVVQGPSSVLFGRGSAGGVIAQNSKQAFLGSQIGGELMVGTNDLARATVDVNQKINANSAVRLNAMAQTNKVAERDYAKFRRAGFAPTISFGLGTDTRTSLSYFHQEENNVPDYGIPFYAGEPAETDRKNFYGFKNDYFKSTADIATAKIEHDFSDDLSLRNQTRYARYTRDTQISNPSTSDNSSVSRSMIIRQSLETYLGNQTDLTSKFSTLGVDHTLVSGLMLERESSNPNNFTSSAPTTTLQNPSNPNFASTVSYNGDSRTTIDTVGVYALDTIKLNKSWELSLGARFDNLRTNYSNQTSAGVRSALSQTDNVFSYNTGVVYKPAKEGSVYLNHGTSFSPSAESISLSTTSNNLNPEKTTSYELGTKWDLFKKRLTANFAIFRVEKDNVRETVNGVGVLSGKQRVDGLLLQASGKITDKWNLMAGYSLMDSRLVKSVSAPTAENRDLTNTPKHTFSFFTTYELESKLTIGGGANFVSERFVSPTSSSGATTDSVTGNVRNIPSYVLFNAMAKYPLSKNISLQLNVNNITNEYYFDQLRGTNAAVPGEGRVFLLSTNIKF